MKKKATVKVVSFKILASEFSRINYLSRRTGVKPGPIMRSLLRKALAQHGSSNLELISLIEMGNLFRRK